MQMRKYQYKYQRRTTSGALSGKKLRRPWQCLHRTRKGAASRNRSASEIWESRPENTRSSPAVDVLKRIGSNPIVHSEDHKIELAKGTHRGIQLIAPCPSPQWVHRDAQWEEEFDVIGSVRSLPKYLATHMSIQMTSTYRSSDLQLPCVVHQGVWRDLPVLFWHFPHPQIDKRCKE